MPATYADRLLQWWDDHGRKDLPWQHPRTAYRVWISEIMLQQTQVATVIPYFARWMERFPGLEDLAAAHEDDVLAQWAGLGYYARARNLHRAAGECAADHGGELPLEPDALTALPGIGLSTANAIISQVTDKPAAVLDGNVKRTLARHALVSEWTGSSKALRVLWREAEARLPGDRGADYTQAAMDLGALVCVRGTPDCVACPVSEDCRAALEGLQADIPVARPSRKPKKAAMALLVLRDDEGRLLLTRRPPSGIWGGLWTFPSADGLDELAADLGIEIGDCVAMDSRLHRLTHMEITIRPYRAGKRSPGAVESSAEQRWLLPDQAAGLGVPKPVADLLQELIDGDIE